MSPCSVIVLFKTSLNLWKFVIALVQICAKILFVLGGEIYSRITPAYIDLLDELGCAAHFVFGAGKYFAAIAANHLNVATVAVALFK